MKDENRKVVRLPMLPFGFHPRSRYRPCTRFKVNLIPSRFQCLRLPGGSQYHELVGIYSDSVVSVRITVPSHPAVAGMTGINGSPHAMPLPLS